jgi:hypothetical protein
MTHFFITAHGILYFMVRLEELTQLVGLLPEAVQNGRGFEIRNKGFAWFYAEKVPGRKGRIEHSDILAIRVADLEEKEALLASDPGVYFTDAHYRGYPAVLVRLAEVEISILTELLTDAWCLKAPKRLIAAYKKSALTDA